MRQNVPDSRCSSLLSPLPPCLPPSLPPPLPPSPPSARRHRRRHDGEARGGGAERRGGHSRQWVDPVGFRECDCECDDARGQEVLCAGKAVEEGTCVHALPPSLPPVPRTIAAISKEAHVFTTPSFSPSLPPSPPHRAKRWTSHISSSLMRRWGRRAGWRKGRREGRDRPRTPL